MNSSEHVEQDGILRTRNVKDLAGILNDPKHGAIRELAQNPLLLTIIALVHRIEADLPDERVLLYRKCAETLLSTWHNYKFADVQDKKPGRPHLALCPPLQPGHALIKFFYPHIFQSFPGKSPLNIPLSRHLVCNHGTKRVPLSQNGRNRS